MTEPVDIVVVGMGIKTADHLTRETEQAIRQCNEVLVVDTGAATEDLLRGLCPKVTHLFLESYTHDHNRLHAYHHMAARVVEAALDHPPVAFAMHGHPTVFCYAPFLIRDMASLLDLRVRVLPGISSLACLFAELMVDPGVQGIVMYEVTDMLLRRRPLHPDQATVLWQVGNVETRLHSTAPSRPERLVRLRDYLLTGWPETHPVTAFYSSPHPLMPSVAWTFPLGEITRQAAQLHAGITLYLPPARERPIQDFDLLSKIDDPAHLRKVTG